MSEIELLREQVRRAERHMRILGVAVVLLTGTLLIAAARPRPDILRVRGLVITDASGRERIVLGAPMREVSDNSALAQAVGLVVLDTLARLHVAVGANNPLVLPGGKMGSRIATSAGLTIYDPRSGVERGGIGAFSDGRANVCLDYGTAAKEAACMSVAPEDQYAAVLLNGTPKEKQFDRVAMFVGADGTGLIKAFGGGSNEGGVAIRGGKGPPMVAVFDSTGARVADLAQRP